MSSAASRDVIEIELPLGAQPSDFLFGMAGFAMSVTDRSGVGQSRGGAGVERRVWKGERMVQSEMVMAMVTRGREG
jgi:hypothetical protein